MAKEKNKRVPGIEIGDSGTQIWDGYITSDYNSTLSGSNAMSTYDEMRKSDATVKALLQACTLPIRSAKWYVEPASQDKQDEEIAEFVEWNLKEGMSITWDDFIRQALLNLSYGVMLFEKVFEFKEDGKIGLKKLAPRLPTGVYKWETLEHKDGITWTKQDGKQVSIPMEKLAVFVNEKEGDNWWGISLLRPCYKHWYFKNNFYKIDAVGSERQGIGIPYVKLPKGANDSDRTIAKGIAENLRSHENAYVVYSEDYEVGFMKMEAGSIKDLEPSIQHHNREILLTGLAQFLDLGAGATGSRALSQDHSQLFYNAISAVASGIADVLNRYVIPQLVDLNWNVKDYPQIKFAHIGPVDYDKVSSALQKLLQSGALTQDEQLEAHTRELFGLPEKEETEKVEEIKETPKEEPKEELEDEGTLKKKASDKKIVFKEIKANRELTFAEKKVHFSTIQDHFELFENDFVNKTKPILTKSKDKFLTDLEKALLSTSPATAIKNISVGYKNDYKNEVSKVLRETFDWAKGNAATEMGKPNIATPILSKQKIAMNSDFIANSDTERLVKEIKKETINAVNQSNVPFSQMTKSQKLALMAPIAAKASETVDLISEQASQTAIGGQINQGRRAIFNAYDDDIYALQRSEILDSRICNFCLSMDGRVVKKTDPIANQDIFHTNCRGIWVEILKDEVEKPPIKEIPKSIKEKLGTGVNDITQPKTPIVRKTSPAGEFAKEDGRLES